MIDWINNHRVDLNAGNPLLVRIDFKCGPYYEIGDVVRLVDLDPAQGCVLGTVKDIKKYPDKGTFAEIIYRKEDMIYWSPKTQAEANGT